MAEISFTVEFEGEPTPAAVASLLWSIDTVYYFHLLTSEDGPRTEKGAWRDLGMIDRISPRVHAPLGVKGSYILTLSYITMGSRVSGRGESEHSESLKKTLDTIKALDRHRRGKKAADQEKASAIANDVSLSQELIRPVDKYLAEAGLDEQDKLVIRAILIASLLALLSDVVLGIEAGVT